MSPAVGGPPAQHMTWQNALTNAARQWCLGMYWA